MNIQQGIQWRIEIISWLIGFICLSIALFPIFQTLNSYIFSYITILYFLLFFHFTRYIFFLKYSPLANFQKLKVVLIFICIPLIFHEIEQLQAFHAFLDENGTQGFAPYLKPGINATQQQEIFDYVRNLLGFFGVASILSSLLFPIRMLISYWRIYNKTGKV